MAPKVHPDVMLFGKEVAGPANGANVDTPAANASATVGWWRTKIRQA
jgi:hypothetical protein